MIERGAGVQRNRALTFTTTVTRPTSKPDIARSP